MAKIEYIAPSTQTIEVVSCEQLASGSVGCPDIEEREDTWN